MILGTIRGWYTFSSLGWENEVTRVSRGRQSQVGDSRAREEYTVMVSEADQGWIGEVRNDPRSFGELTEQVQKLQQARGAAAVTAVSQSTMDTRLRKPQVFRGRETKRQEG